MSDFVKPFKKATRWVSDLGESIYKPLAGEPTSKQIRDDEEAARQSNAAAAAAEKQALFEASTKAGLERIALRRRKGFMASMLVDPGSTLGSTSTLGA